MNDLFKDREQVDYSECIDLINHIEQMNMIQSDDDENKVEELKNLLEEYNEWLN